MDATDFAKPAAWHSVDEAKKWPIGSRVAYRFLSENGQPGEKVHVTNYFRSDLLTQPGEAWRYLNKYGAVFVLLGLPPGKHKPPVSRAKCLAQELFQEVVRLNVDSGKLTPAKKITGWNHVLNQID